MPKKVGVADVMKKFSEVISKVSLKGEHFVIERKGNPMAAMVRVNDLEMIQDSKKGEKREFC